MSWNRVYGYNVDSFQDWPGRITPVIFVSGCNFRCVTCHNKEIAFEIKPNVPRIDPSFIEYDIKSKKIWYEGVVLSGGEVTTLPDVLQWINEIKTSFDLPIKIDTNGFRPEIIERLLTLNLVDLFAVDLKGPFNKYSQLTGISLESQYVQLVFFKLFDLAIKYPERFMFRTTTVPFLNEKDIEVIRNYLPTGFQLHLQPYIKRAGESYARVNSQKK